nr:MAG: replication associated protein [Arizlama virus]
MSYRNWVFTLNADEDAGEQIEWTNEGIPCPLGSWLDSSDITYLVCQVEQVGHVHIQGYVEFKKAQRLAACKKVNAQAHWEPRRGSQKQAIAYCQKEESRVNGPWELGEMKKQGSRADLESIYEAVQQRKSNLQMVEDIGPSVAKFEKHINFLRMALLEKSSNRKVTGVKVITLYGPTGKGKTTTAIELFGHDDPATYYKVSAPAHKNTKVWFSGYTGQPVLILDEFSGNFVPVDYLKGLLDYHPLMVETKGGHAWACWTTVVITTNCTPNAWYSGIDPAPLIRRLTTKGSEIRLLTEYDLYQVVDWNETPIGDIGHHTLPTQPLPPTQPDTVIDDSEEFHFVLPTAEPARQARRTNEGPTTTTTRNGGLNDITYAT